MIAIARKNLPCLFWNPNSFLCNSNAPFSTSRLKRVIPSPEIYDVLLHKHHFSPELATLAASRLHQFRSPKTADSIISFLKENSFTTTQLQKIVLYDPQILRSTVEGIKLKFKVFQDLGLSSEEIAKIMSSHQSILHSSMANRIIPALSTLKGLLGSNQDVARLLNKSAWFLTSNLKETLMPNVEILKSCGIPVERILHFLYIHPRSLLMKPDIMRKSVDKAIEYGVSKSSINFIHTVGIIGSMSEGIRDVKLQAFRDLGLTDSDILTIFKRSPSVLTLSMEKVKKKIELLLATGKYNISNIAADPVSLGCSIEKRLEPRLQILGVLENNNLINKWPALRTIHRLSDDKFLERFVRPYSKKVGKAFDRMSYLEGKINET